MKNILIDFNDLDESNISIYREIYINSFDEYHIFIEDLLKQNSEINLLISHPLFSRNN